jgi:hypothetical protein
MKAYSRQELCLFFHLLNDGKRVAGFFLAELLECGRYGGPGRHPEFGIAVHVIVNQFAVGFTVVVDEGICRLAVEIPHDVFIQSLAADSGKPNAIACENQEYDLFHVSSRYAVAKIRARQYRKRKMARQSEIFGSTSKIQQRASGKSGKFKPEWID